MNIKGLQKTSLIDFPGEICATVFVGGCNFRCRYCYNSDLVINHGEMRHISQERVCSFLEERSFLLDGVCISGGEPTLQENLPGFVARIKSLGLKVKLDTNGGRPEIIEALARAGLLDYIAVDIKAPWHRYPMIAGAEEEVPRIKKTVLFLLNNELEVDFEFRTTVVPGLLDEEDMVEIAGQIGGCKKFVLQQFRPQTGLMDPALETVKPYSPEIMERFAAACKRHVQSVILRGL